MVIRLLIISFSLLSLLSCFSKKEKRQITPAFYHWQTAVNLSELEKNYLQDFPIQKLYLKFFDVDIEQGQVVPKALIYGDSLSILFKNKEIIPTIFITNRTLKEITTPAILDLSLKITDKIKYLAKENQLHFQEIQLDCDWTLTTKDAYFDLIEKIKVALLDDVKISATIRLHQIKFAHKTGVPPVDRGILMYYNMGELADEATSNSILDNAIGRQYLEGFTNYPLALDVALPIFAWGVLFRDGRMIRLINDLRFEDMVDTSNFKQLDQIHFSVKKSGYLKGYYLYEGDNIRLENINQNSLEVAAELLSPLLNTQHINLVFYHLDATNLQVFSKEDLKKIVHVFEKE